MTNSKKPFMVILTEYERGWGSKEFHRAYFDTLEAAKKYAAAENAKNNLPTAPDWYVVASEPQVNPEAK
jgi:hypothetical protein